MQTHSLTEQERAKNILKIEVDYFLSTLKDSQEFIFRKVALSKEFLNFKKKFEKKELKLFSDEELMREAPKGCIF